MPFFASELINRRSGDQRREQFDRDHDLESLLRVPNCAVVIGLGGIGSHVAEILGSCNECSHLILFDDDKIELSNLNRSAYSYHHIDCYKVEAISEIISIRNPHCVVVPFPEKFIPETVEEFLKSGLMNSRNYMGHFDGEIDIAGNYCHIFDCRDNDYDDSPLMELFAQRLGCVSKLWRAAYNGTSITLDGSPKDHPCWGDAGYGTIPSHSLPSRLVALLIVIYASMDKSIDPTSMKHPYTFDVEDIMPMIYMGTAYQKVQRSSNMKLMAKMDKLFEFIHNHPDKINDIDMSYNTNLTNDINTL